MPLTNWTRLLPGVLWKLWTKRKFWSIANRTAVGRALCRLRQATFGIVSRTSFCFRWRYLNRGFYWEYLVGTTSGQIWNWTLKSVNKWNCCRPFHRSKFPYFICLSSGKFFTGPFLNVNNYSFCLCFFFQNILY